MSDLLLLPMPQKFKRIDGCFAPEASARVIELNGASPVDLMPAGLIVQSAASNAVAWNWPIVAGQAEGNVAAVQILIGSEIAHPQGYRLTITPGQIQLIAASPTAAFYGAQTLAQLFRQFGSKLPCVEIEDWPDLAVRGVMLDISRDKVPTMATLFSLVDLFASLKINQLQLYTEHTFAYRAHPQVWAEASPITGQQILELDAYCRARFVELVPNQNSFGHMERWLKLPRYKHLAETPDGFSFPWGLRHEGGFTLDPVNPQSLELVNSLYDELLPHFSSRLFNAGCDETFDLGLGKSKAAVEKLGKERVYLDFLLKIHSSVSSRGRQMMFWGDIILHKPELIPELPKDLIALNWGYDIGHPFEKETRAFQEAGVPFYVCPGTSSWLTISGRTENALANLLDAAEQGIRHGAAGYLNTDWGDVGHLQHLPVSYLGFAAGAAYSWCLAGNRETSIADQLSWHVFQDPSLEMGKLVYDLGNVYKLVQGRQFNSTALFWSLVGGVERKTQYEIITRQAADESEAALNALQKRLANIKLGLPDAAQIVAEFSNAIAMLKHACRRARWRLDAQSENTVQMADELRAIIGEYQQLWLARNRVGGLRDSVRRLETRLAEYGVGRVSSAFG